jgi:hypothetical protein
LEVPVYDQLALLLLGLWQGSTSWWKCVGKPNHSPYDREKKKKGKRGVWAPAIPFKGTPHNDPKSFYEALPLNVSTTSSSASD